MRPPLAGLYGITSAQLCEDPARLLRAVAAALRGGTRWVQYRDKHATPAQRLCRATALAGLCRDHGAGFIVNDDVDLALQVAADGVHIGAGDGDIAATRVRLGPEGVLGVTCGDDLARARHAVRLGADYVAFGRLFPSHTAARPPGHPARGRQNADRAGLRERPHNPAARGAGDGHRRAPDRRGRRPVRRRRH